MQQLFSVFSRGPSLGNFSPASYQEHSGKLKNDGSSLEAPINLLPPKILMHIFSFLDFSTSLKLPLVCKRWVDLTESKMAEGQLLGRIKILDAVLNPGRYRDAYPLPNKSEEGMLIRKKVQKFLDQSAPDFSTLSIPGFETSMQNKADGERQPCLGGEGVGCEPITQEDLCTAVQTYLEMEVRNLKSRKYADPTICLFDRDIFDVHSKSAWEQKGIHDFLRPFLDKTISEHPMHTGLPDGNYIGMIGMPVREYTLPVFSAVMQALARSDKTKRLSLSCNVAGVASMHQLIMFDQHIVNQTLLRAKQLYTLSFGSSDIHWTAHKGLELIREGLIKAPKLKKIYFTGLRNTTIDEENAQSLAEILLLRRQNKSVSAIEELYIGLSSITLESCIALVEPLRNYPASLVINIEADGNFIPVIFSENRINNVLNQNKKLHFRIVYTRSDGESWYAVYDRKHQTYRNVEGDTEARRVEMG